MNKKSLAALAMGLILGTSGAAQAIQFSAAMTNDMYNSNTNTPNGIPTPRYTPGLGIDLFNAANTLNPSYNFTQNSGLDPYWVSQDQTFKVNQSYGQMISFFVLGRGALNVNALGYYTRTADGSIVAKSAPFLTGVTGFGSYATSPNTYVGTQFVAPQGMPVLGWYISSFDARTNTTNTYYSEAYLNTTSNPADSLYDHVITYALPDLQGLTLNGIANGKTFTQTLSSNSYLIGFKDKSVTPVYDPAHPGYGPTLGDDDYNDIMILADISQIRPTDPITNPPLVPEPATFVLVGAGLAGLWVMGRRKRS
jgi:PEP-CTERM motif